MKHVDSGTLPIDELKIVWDAILAKNFTDLTAVSKLLYVASWAVDWLGNRKEGPVVFGETEQEAEFCELCGQIIDWAEDATPRAAGSAIGAWLVKAMLLALLNRLIRELAEGGALPDWLADVIERIKEQIDAL
jgi:hypothetical protein